MKADITEPREYAVQSKASGELGVGRPVVFVRQVPGDEISLAIISEIDGWLIEAPQATKLSFYLNRDGFGALMDILGEL